MSFELVALKNGLYSLRALDNLETFHPVTGPEAEANILYVKQQRLVERASQLGRLVIWDVGLGAAANAVAVLRALRGSAAPVELHSFDSTLAPLRFALGNSMALSYLLEFVPAVEELLARGHVQVGAVHWVLHEGEFGARMADAPSPDAINYDPYSPGSNPEMWTLDHFRLIRARLDRPCLWTNYTRSTSVRVGLLLAGFYVGYGWAVGEKDQTTAAATELSLLDWPLERNWLERVKISRNAAPLRAQRVEDEAISAEDLAALERHPQFME